jgi:hypothetical protein
MIKKRAGTVESAPLAKPSVPVIGVGADPNQPTGLPVKGTASASAASSSGSAEPSGGLNLSIPPLDSVLGGVTGSASQTASAANATASSSIPQHTESSSSIVQPTQSVAQDPNSTPSANLPVSTPQSTALTTVISTENAQATSNSTQANASAAGATAQSTHIAKTTIIIIAAIGGGIALIAIVWTVIRKWKFRPSDEFEDRLNPINWDPSSNSLSDSGIMTERPQPGGGLYRSNSRGSNRSFHSADAASQHHQQQYQQYSDNNSLIPDLPNHDFTAGAPGGGQQRVYADLYRGPSPGPNHATYNANGYGGY